MAHRQRAMARSPGGNLRTQADGLRQRRRHRSLPPRFRRTRAGAARATRTLGRARSSYASAASRSARTRCAFSMRSRGLLACRPDAQLVIAGGASLLDHGALSNAIPSRLATMGDGAGVRAPARDRRRQRHAAPLPPRRQRSCSSRSRRDSGSGAGGHGERPSCRRLGDRAVHRVSRRRRRDLVRSDQCRPRSPTPWRWRSRPSSPRGCAATACASRPASTGARSREPTCPSTNA